MESISKESEKPVNANNADIKVETVKIEGPLQIAKKTSLGRRWISCHLFVTEESIYCLDAEVLDGKWYKSTIGIVRLSDLASIRQKPVPRFLRQSLGQITLALKDGQIIKLRTSSLDELRVWTQDLEEASSLQADDSSDGTDNAPANEICVSGPATTSEAVTYGANGFPIRGPFFCRARAGHFVCFQAKRPEQAIRDWADEMEPYDLEDKKLFTELRIKRSR